MTMEKRFIKLLDGVSFRGNKAFGETGAFGPSQFPPRPSVLSGAFRAELLNAYEVGLKQYRADCQPKSTTKPECEESLSSTLGSPNNPGNFAIAGIFPARQKIPVNHQQATDLEYFFPLPADVEILEETTEDDRKKIIHIRSIQPTAKPNIQYSSEQLPYLPLFETNHQEDHNPAKGKPASGYLLTQTALAKYLAGERLDGSEDAIKQDTLWQRDIRVGVTLDQAKRSAEDGGLFTTEFISPLARHTNQITKTTSYQEVGLLVAIAGCTLELPESGNLRLGGDGRVAFYEKPTIPLPAIHQIPEITSHKKGEGFKVICLTPALFSQGWLPDCIQKQKNDKTQQDEYWLTLESAERKLTARLACIALKRHEVISGWDVANWKPKDAERVVSAGSVYWFDQVNGNTQLLKNWLCHGLWTFSQTGNKSTADAAIKQRHTEGYNRVLIGTWKTTDANTPT